MRGAKQHHSWKLDDERRKRPSVPSHQPSPTSTHHNSPNNHTHERHHSGI